jgi:hypothetical protein
MNEKSKIYGGEVPLSAGMVISFERGNSRIGISDYIVLFRYGFICAHKMLLKKELIRVYMKIVSQTAVFCQCFFLNVVISHSFLT